MTMITLSLQYYLLLELLILGSPEAARPSVINEPVSLSQSNTIETIEMSCRWMWDAESPDIEDWQIIQMPRGLINTPFGDLIVADSGNSRLVRFTMEGELIEIIGREGGGPGEFVEPRGLAFEPGGTILWVADRLASRISQFQINQHSSEFLSSFIAPQVRVQFVSNLLVQDEHSFYRIPIWNLTQ